jgi:hypothetical protein
MRDEGDFHRIDRVHRMGRAIPADRVYADLQDELMENPEKGDIIKGCGGLRKIRARDPKRQKGKRGGVRIIYLYIPEAKWFYMLDIYDKDEKVDLSANEKRVLSKLAEELAQEAKARTAGRKGKKT